MAARAVVVTGASTGIGRATVQTLLSHGIAVFGSVRRADDGTRLARELDTTKARFTPLLFDVTDEAAVAAGAAQVGATLGGARLAGLVNNAGIAIPGPLALQPLAEIRAHIEVNLFGPLIVTRAFLPLLGTDAGLSGPAGRIVNVSSVAGRLAMPFVGAYVASKHALEGMSDSLRCELLPYGIDVVVVGPGSVVTPIWDKAEARDASPYAATAYGPILQRFQAFMLADARRGLPPERIGRVIHHALTAPRPRVRYAVVPRRLLNWSVPMALPRRLLDGYIARQLGMARV